MICNLFFAYFLIVYLTLLANILFLQEMQSLCFRIYLIFYCLLQHIYVHIKVLVAQFVNKPIMTKLGRKKLNS